jgi:hypothetical protein
MTVTTANLNAAVAKAQADYAVSMAAATTGATVLQKATVTVKTNAKPLAIGAGTALVVPHIIPWVAALFTHVLFK